MIRRGLAYVAGDDPGAPPEGVLFVSLQSRLDDQFEFVQRSWLNDGAVFGLGRDPDALSGHWAGLRQIVLPGLDARTDERDDQTALGRARWRVLPRAIDPRPVLLGAGYGRGPLTATALHRTPPEA